MKINTSVIQKKVQPMANKLSNNRYIKAMMGGMMMALPATIIGAIASLLKTLPIEAYQNFIISNGIDKILQMPITFTTNITALIFVVCITYSLTESFEVKGMGASILALVCFLINTPVIMDKNSWGQDIATIPMDWLGSMGIFSAIIIAFAVGSLYVYIVQKGWTIKMPESVPPFVKDSFASLVPGAIIAALFLVVAGIFANTPFGTMHSLIYGLIQIPLQNIGGSFGAMLLVSILCQLFWFFGIHGMAVLSVVMPIWGALDVSQLSAYSSGSPLPNILGMNFYMIFTVGGTALGLAILLLIAKSQRFKTLGKLAIVPAIFGITEPILFGTPLILNPIFAIPLIFGNVISLILAYVGTLIGILPRLSGIGAPSGTPIVLQGLIAGGWKIALFQLVLVILWVVLWYPFFKMADNKALQEESGIIEA